MSKTALIIDDCFDTTKITSFLLKKLGIEKIFIAHNKEDFVNFWNLYKPDLVITDWNISQDFKGDKVIAEASSLKIPVALVTSEEKDLIFDTINSAFYDTFAFFQKPLNLSSLKDWLDNIS
jgi:DNA-binding NtrC family response regulator